MLSNSRFVSTVRRQRGLSLVELLVGIAVGMFVVAAAAMLVGTQLSENRRLLLETQLQQDLRASADIITRELRRAGYWSQADLGVWTTASDAIPNSFADITTSGTTEVAFTYRRGPGQEGPYGFKLDGPTYALKSLMAASGWQELTDPRTLRITALNITPANGPSAVLPCPRLCPDGTQDCWPTVTVREFTIDITGQSATDASVQRSLRTTVRLRNDLVSFNDPLNPTQMCPA